MGYVILQWRVSTGAMRQLLPRQTTGTLSICVEGPLFNALELCRQFCIIAIFEQPLIPFTGD